MPRATSTTLRWFATAGVVVLLVLIMLQLASRQRPAADPAQLVKADAADALLTDARPAPASPAALAPAASGSPAPQIAIDVIGAVEQPGVYWLESKARVVDVIAAAGGLAPDADRDRLNLAAPIADGQQIRVPRVGETAPSPSSPDSSPASTGGAAAPPSSIDINSADAAALDSLPGIGPATAEAIIAYREANGPFKRSEDIQNVKGIGPALYAKIASAISVGP